MDKKGPLVPALLAIAAAAFYLITLSGRERALSGQYETTKVLVAALDIPERTLLKEGMARVQEIPRAYVAQDAFEVRTQSDLRMITNLVARVRIPKGNQISQSALVSMSPDSGLSVKVPPGYRAAVLGIEPELRTLVKPGDRVDVLITFDANIANEGRQKVTATILQNILVIGVGNNLGQGMTAAQFRASGEAEAKAAPYAEKASISLALNPEELQYLALAQTQGTTTIGLRAMGDVEMHPIKVARLGSLIN